MLKLSSKNLEENTPENTLGKYLIEKSIASKERLISKRSIFIDIFNFGFDNKKHYSNKSEQFMCIPKTPHQQ